MSLTRRALLAGAGASVALGATPALARARVKPSELLDQHDAIGMAKLVRARKVSASELLEAAIERTQLLTPQLNFMAQQHFGFARAAVEAGLPEGPFTGVPWLLKDLYTSIAGEVTANGSRLYAGQRAPVTSELVRRHQKAGFVIFGKTTTPEFGLTATTESELFGATRNPWDTGRIAGGSSGGAAVAVASGVVPAAHASDGGGSIRIPASCCGLFGLKPSRGRVPMGPGRTEGWGGLSTNHAITRTVRDSAAILDATWGLEPGSRYSAPAPDAPYLEQVTRAPGRLRIALMLEPLAGSPVDGECVQAARDAARLCESLGHYVEEAAPKIDAGQLAFASFAIMGPSLLASLSDQAKSLGVALDNAVIEPITLGFTEYGKSFAATDYARGDAILQSAAITMAQFMTDYDLILSPTLAAPPLELGQINLSPGIDFQSWGQRVATFSPFTQIANHTGQPAMSVPLGMSKDGLPIGVQFLARYGAEDLLFRLAGQLERAAPWAMLRPEPA